MGKLAFIRYMKFHTEKLKKSRPKVKGTIKSSHPKRYRTRMFILIYYRHKVVQPYENVKNLEIVLHISSVLFKFKNMDFKVTFSGTKFQ